MSIADPSQSFAPDYAAPDSLEEALSLLSDGLARVVAGGTDLMIQSRSGTRNLGLRLVNIRRIPALAGIDVLEDGAIRIGALVTMTQIAGDPVLAKRVPLLPAMADRFASDQIRNMASLGGNLCNASPAADGPVALLALDAEAELCRLADGAITSRRVPLTDFFAGPGKTVMTADELLTAVVFKPPPPGFRAGFAKSGPRPALEIALVSAAVGLRRDGEKFRDVRIALGAVAPTPIRAHKAEQMLEGQAGSPTLIQAAAEAAAEAANPIDDHRADAWYRRHLLRVYCRRLLEDLGHG